MPAPRAMPANTHVTQAGAWASRGVAVDVDTELLWNCAHGAVTRFGPPHLRTGHFLRDVLDDAGGLVLQGGVERCGAGVLGRGALALVARGRSSGSP